MSGWLVVDAAFLRDHASGPFPSCALDRDAAKLVGAYRDGRTRLALVGAEEEHVLRHWAEVRGVPQWDVVRAEEPDLYAVAETLRVESSVSLVMTGNPEQVRRLLLGGFDVVALTRAVYRGDDMRPDYQRTVRSWDDVADQYKVDTMLHAADSRRDPDSARYEDD